MGKKRWSIVLVPEGDGAVRSLKVHSRVLLAGIGVLTMGFLSVAGSVGVHLWNLNGLRSLRGLRQENTALRSHLSTVNQAIQRVETMVADGERMEKEARILAGLDPIDAQTRELGVGGPLLTMPEGTGQVDSAVLSTLKEQNDRIDQLSRRVTFQHDSFQDTIDRLRKITDRLAHTPTICPLRGQYVVSAGFGWRSDPFTGQRAFHSGLDLSAEPGTPVYSSADGQVVFVGPDGEFGLCVRVKHGYGYETAYCHLAATHATMGQMVHRGDLLGNVGSSGRSTGPHLHYEVWINGVTQDPTSHILTPHTIAD